MSVNENACPLLQNDGLFNEFETNPRRFPENHEKIVPRIGTIKCGERKSWGGSRR